MRSIPSLPFQPRLFCPGVLAVDAVLSIDQIELFKLKPFNSVQTNNYK